MMRHQLSDEDIKLHILIASLCNSMSLQQKTLFAKIMSIMKNMCIKMNCSLFEDKRIPTSYNDISTTYVKGANSIIQNLPTPETIVVDSHSYTPLLQCIADVLGHVGSNTLQISPNLVLSDTISSPQQSIRASEIANRAKTTFEGISSDGCILFIYEWSDGFEPTSSSKNNRGGAWAKTVTISFHRNNSIEMENTYAIAFGPSNASHESVERMFADELSQLKSGRCQFYHGDSRQMIRIYADVFVT